MAANNNLELIPESLCRCWGKAGQVWQGNHSIENPRIIVGTHLVVFVHHTK